MQQKIFKPDYSHGLVNLSNSLAVHFGLPAGHSTLPELDRALNEHDYKNVVLLVMDGMGSDMLRQNLPENSFLRSHLTADISSVYPPTTAAATTSIYSGLTPKEHGWAGWQCYFKEYDKNIELFRDVELYSQQPAGTHVGKDFLDYKKLFERINEAGKYAAYGVAACWGDFTISSFEDVCDKIAELSESPHKKFIMAYWKHPDGVMHKTGCYSAQTKETIKDLDSKIAGLAAKFENTLLVITADHGLIDIEKNVNLNEIKELDDCLRLLPGIEPRTVAFYIKPEKKADFEQIFKQYFGTEYILLTADEYIRQGYMGEGDEHPKLREFLGDYIAIAIGTTILQYQTPDGLEPPAFAAHHAGLTEKEMQVPLIIFANK